MAVLVTISPLFTAVKAVNPGFRSIITQKGLDYGKPAASIYIATYVSIQLRIL